MKKNILLLGLAAGFLFTTSCKREYACHCKYDETHDDHSHKKEVSYPLGSLSKSDAESKCDDKATALAADEDHSNINCELKK